MSYLWFVYFLIVLIVLILGYKLSIRLRLSRAKHPSLRGHVKWSRRVARMIPAVDYDESQFFASDAAPQQVLMKRRKGFARLAEQLQQLAPKSIAFMENIAPSISDVQFTNAYRVPPVYSRYVRTHLKLGTVAVASQGVQIKDMDDNWSYDLTGAYGVNVYGYDFYKSCMEDGWQTVKDLGPVLGPLHPVVADNVEKLKAISGLDEISFHMSGTEAVMQAVYMARYHTGKTHLVRLCGAYHGWWDGVQVGVGGHRETNDVYTLQDMSDATLKVLETRHDIACLLINPLQALHPNGGAPSDGSLMTSERSAGLDKSAYTAWLQQLRDVCTRRGIVLIFDEVFTGFRLAYRGAQEYFGIQADMVTYGKTLGGGLPVGVLCGTHALMKRFRDEQPLNISFARGTFNSHPYVMATMHEFLQRIALPEHRQHYETIEDCWNIRVETLNQRFQHAGLPVRIANMSSIWTLLFELPSRYNWMYQYYLRLHGVTLSWVGSGRVIMSHNFTDDDYELLMQRLITAAKAMQEDGWWWQSPQLSNQSIKKTIMREMLRARFPRLKCLWKETDHA